MIQDLAKREGCKIGDTFLSIPPGTSKERWVRIATEVTRLGHGYWWWVGDLAAFAMHHLTEDAIKELCAATGTGEKYIKMTAWASQKYPVRDRVRGLSITHHLRVAHLPRAQRQALLQRAANHQWPVRVLEQHVAPLSKRTLSAVLHFPAKYGKDKKFLMALKRFCAENCVTRYWIVGLNRHTTAKKRPPLRQKVIAA